MKVILINPNSTLAAGSRRYRRFLTPLLPMGIAYIAAVLEKNGIETIIIDQFANKISNRELAEKINVINPQVVGISCLTSTMNNVEDLCRQIKVNRRWVVLGNIHPTIFADELLRRNIANIVVRGEGEFSMLEILLAINKNKSFKDIKGISYSFNGRIYHNREGGLIEDLDKLPYPAWHLFNLKYYREAPLISIYDLVLPIQASRGCPFRCTFCAQDRIYKKPRYRFTRYRCIV